MWWPREVQSSIRVAKESWGLLSSDCRANRPHLGLCPEASVALRGRQGSRGCIPDTPGETGIHLEWKHSTPLCSRVATGISWSSLGGLKGVKPPEAIGERSRGWPLGHAGDEGPRLRDDGGTTWFFSSCGGILELRRGIQHASCVGPGKSNLPFESRRKAGDCSRVTAGPIDLI